MISFGIKKSASGHYKLICRADWIRTSDPYVPNVMRYRAALLPEKKESRVDWIRTSDLLHPMQMRYRAAPPPEH